MIPRTIQMRAPALGGGFVLSEQGRSLLAHAQVEALKASGPMSRLEYVVSMILDQSSVKIRQKSAWANAWCCRRPQRMGGLKLKGLLVRMNMLDVVSLLAVDGERCLSQCTFKLERSIFFLARNITSRTSQLMHHV